MDILRDHGFIYHVDRETTHNKGGSLDVLCTKFAPSTVRKTRVNKSKSYPYDPLIAEVRRVRRCYERQVCKHGRAIDKQLLKAQVSRVRKLAVKAQAKVIKTRIERCTTSKQLFASFDDLTVRRSDTLPNLACSDEEMAQNFSDYFVEKIEKITSGIAVDCEISESNVVSNVPVFNDFEPVSEISVLKLGPVKFCEVDILPNNVLKNNYTSLLPYITVLINLSLSKGIFPDYFKSAQIKPFLKNQSLDSNSMKSYRSVSHLTFISKVLKTAVKDQLLGHLERNNLVHGNQSAYRSGHSVETTLMDIHSEIAHAFDEGKSAFLLDLSATFDTISHSNLLRLLKNSFGVGGTVLSWIQSYLSSRSTSVKIRSAFSETRISSVGVPQGSFLRPVPFNCVMSPLAHLLEDMGVLCHIYADGTQFLVKFDNEEESAARRKIL